jgi:serine/threonine protein kinase
VSSRSLDSSLLKGITIDSERHPGVRYRIERALGEGGMGIVFFALRDAPEGIAPVVIKVVRPEVLASSQHTAETLVRKEVVALERLNSRVPPTPFVVRFIDTGAVALPALGVALPWIAVEYVHGGLEGTTLEQRVRYCTDNTGFAFDPVRASLALRSLGAGLAAVHDVQVIHRDITPGNVLCCGFGEAEIFKVSDFGLARMHSLETFGKVMLGTPAYTAPEQNFKEEHDVGSYSDVFSLACVAYFLLTGESYFDAASVPQALMAVRSEARKSVLSSQGLCPELRADVDACRAIDATLALATSKDPGMRPKHAQELTSPLSRALSREGAPETARASRRLVHSVLSLPSPVAVRGWQWTVRHPPRSDVALHGIAWESDGHCVAASTSGVVYWSGTSWIPAPTGTLAPESAVRCVHRVRAGTWVLGGDEVIAVYSTGGIQELIPCAGASFQHANGHLEDLLVAVNDRTAGFPELWMLSGRRWHAPIGLGEFRVVSSVSRLGPTAWLLAGRRRDGTGAIALCRPLERSLSFLTIPPTRAMLATASQPERELGLSAGTQGVVVSVHAGGVTTSILEGQPNVSACAADILDREWAGGSGRLWVKEPGPTSSWRSVWEDGVFSSPFVSVMADVGMVLAVTADGGVLEGRAPWSVVGSNPPSS